MKRHTAEIRRSCPTMTTERYMQGYERAQLLVNTMIGIANEVARLAISDGIDAIRKAGLYKQKTKQLCNETFRRQEEYEAYHNGCFDKERLKMWLDYLDGTEDEYRKHIFNIYMAVKSALDRYNQKDTELKARIECGRICAQLAVGQFDALMKDMKEEYGVDYTPLFTGNRYTNPLHTWMQLSGMYSTQDGPERIDLNKDANTVLAAEILARKLSDSDILNRIGKHALSVNMETAKKYANEDDLKEIGLI